MTEELQCPGLTRKKLRLTDKKVPYTAGSVRHCLDYWKRITSDQYVLNIVTGSNIELDASPNFCALKPYETNQKAAKQISNEVAELLDMQAIELCEHEPGEYISPI